MAIVSLFRQNTLIRLGERAATSNAGDDAPERRFVALKIEALIDNRWNCHAAK